MDLNTEYLKTLNSEDVKSLKNMIRDIDIKQVRYKDLYKLLYNYFFVKYTYPRYVLGVKVIYKLVSVKYKQIVYLFGEKHLDYEKPEKIKNSSRPDDFFSKLLKTTSKPIDLYIETAPQEGIHGKKKDMERLRNTFEQCYLKIRNCEYYGSRIHYTDLRNMNNILDISQEFGLYSAGIISFDEAWKRSLNRFSGFEELKLLERPISIQKMRQILGDTPAFKMINKQMRNSFVNKDTKNSIYNKLLDDTISLLDKIRKTIVLFLSEYFGKKLKIKENNQNVINILYQIFTKQKPIVDEKLNNEFVKILKMFPLKLGTKIMDVYTFFRMTRSFRKVPFQNSINPRNIIYYSGALHSANLIPYFTLSGYKLVKEYGPSGSFTGDNDKEINYVDISDMDNKMFD